MDSAEQESKLVLLVSCELSSTVGSSGSRNDEALIDVDCEVSTLTHNNFSNSRRVKSKQTAQKGLLITRMETMVSSHVKGYLHAFHIKESLPERWQCIWL